MLHCGKEQRVGDIVIGKGGIIPGLGISKQNKAVGDIYIKGIVSSKVSGRQLGNVSLGTVVEMSDIVCDGIISTLISLENKRRFFSA